MKNKGFTLVELLGVIVIIALLSLIIFPNIISSFFEVTTKLDSATKVVVIESAKDYFEKYKNDISSLDYCVSVSNLQNEGMLSYDIKDSDGKIIPSDTIIKIYKNGLKYEVGDTCVVSNDEIKEAAKKYFNDGNIDIKFGDSKCITILNLQNSYYLSKNITNGSIEFDSNSKIKLINNGTIEVTINSSCE